MNEDPSPAVKRAMDLMLVPMDKLPTPAILFSAFLCKKYGVCGEVLLSAYVVYAQIEENLECDESLYKVTDAIRKDWDEVQRDLIRVELPDGRMMVVRKNA